MISMLQTDWGLHADAALWAVQAWMTALDIAEVDTHPDPPASSTQTTDTPTHEQAAHLEEFSALARTGDTDAMFNLGYLLGTCQ